MNTMGIANRNPYVRDKVAHHTTDMGMQTILETYQENPRLEPGGSVKHLKETLQKFPISNSQSHSPSQIVAKAEPPMDQVRLIENNCKLLLQLVNVHTAFYNPR